MHKKGWKIAFEISNAEVVNFYPFRAIQMQMLTHGAPVVYSIDGSFENKHGVVGEKWGVAKGIKRRHQPNRGNDDKGFLVSLMSLYSWKDHTVISHRVKLWTLEVKTFLPSFISFIGSLLIKSNEFFRMGDKTKFDKDRVVSFYYYSTERTTNPSEMNGIGRIWLMMRSSSSLTRSSFESWPRNHSSLGIAGNGAKTGR